MHRFRSLLRCALVAMPITAFPVGAIAAEGPAESSPAASNSPPAGSEATDRQPGIDEAVEGPVGDDRVAADETAAPGTGADGATRTKGQPDEQGGPTSAPSLEGPDSPQPWPYAPPARSDSGAVPSDEPAAASGTDWAFVGGLIVTAVGAGALVAGHYGLFRLNDVVREDELRSYRAGVPEGESSCEAARSGFVSPADGAASAASVVEICDEADSMEMLRNVALPVGAAVAVLGLVLIGTSDTVNGPDEGGDEAAAWRLRLQAGPTGAGAAVTMPF